jgi:hypothetical protein
MRSIISITIFAAILFAAGCGDTAETKPATPLETFRTYSKAVKQKDTTAMKLLLSSETLKMHEQQARSQGTTVDEIVKRETLFNESQTQVQYRNEKIDGTNATLEVKNPSGNWETIPFVFEDDQWKIDKKGHFDRLTRELEAEMQRAEDRINSERLGVDNMNGAVPADPSPTIPE